MREPWTPDRLIKFELKAKDLFEKGEINCPLHLSWGNEEQLITLFESITPNDWVISTHRNHYHYLLKGGSSKKLMDELLGKPSGICGGLGRSMHIFDKSINFISSGIVAGGCAIACGIAMAIKKENKGKKTRPMVWVFIGDGAEDSGHFMEALRFSISRELPTTFIIEDNDLSIDSTKRDRWHNHSPIKSQRVIRYEYKRKWPHVGVGKFVSF